MLTTSSYIKGALAALVLICLGDYVWHNVVLYDFYFSRLSAINGGEMSAEFPLFLLLFEILAAIGMAYFVLNTSNGFSQAASNGAFLGLLMTGAVNFINHSLITLWDINITLVDTAWGIVLGAVAGMAAFAVGRTKSA